MKKKPNYKIIILNPTDSISYCQNKMPIRQASIYKFLSFKQLFVVVAGISILFNIKFSFVNENHLMR